MTLYTFINMTIHPSMYGMQRNCYLLNRCLFFALETDSSSKLGHYCFHQDCIMCVTHFTAVRKMNTHYTVNTYGTQEIEINQGILEFLEFLMVYNILFWSLQIYF